MIFLKSLNGQSFGLDGTHGPDAGLNATDGGENRNSAFDRGAANLNFVLPWSFAAWRINDEINLIVLDHVDDMRASFAQFEKPVHRQSRRG